MIISFNRNLIRPTLDVEDTSPKQIVIRFLPYRDEHLTVHLTDDGSLIRTHHSLNKPESIWDEDRVKTAAAMGIRNPERHRGYIINTPLFRLDNVEGYYLGGRYIDLDSFNPRQRYFNNISHSFNVPTTKFMLQLYLSTAENPVRNIDDRVLTPLGELCFRYEAREN